MKPGKGTKGDATVVAEPMEEQILVWVLFPVLGAGAGWLIKLMAGWLADLPFAPFQRGLEFLASSPEPEATLGSLVVGGLAGLAFAGVAAWERLTVTVTGDAVALRSRGTTQEVTRASVSAVFHDEKRLVLLGTVTEELVREGSDLKADRLRDAFLRHGYPWQEGGDPYAGDYRRWVEDLPGLPSGANALLKARGRALERSDTDDARQLRTELAGLGVVVRDEKKHQFWRLTDQFPR
ncbi:hypothetical protein [Actinomadura sp. HBU206391]|uniref:YqeB family protein n=1 Tax=Actinomadura sp. HBU206391 TaxID=2731692 RepID=UPI00164F89CE|nr:hypothetical protein [Actinomadura sp. HBU206391]MBC6457830.1 hypothetical protein [Actinomadura sp. HBU206391]